MVVRGGRVLSSNMHIKYNSRWMSPLEFENLAGLHGRKWTENIKYEGNNWEMAQ